MRRPVSSVTCFTARSRLAVCAAGSAGAPAFCCDCVSAAQTLRTRHANTPQANVSGMAKNRFCVLVAVKKLSRAIKKPREYSEASRHTLSRGECQFRPVRVGSLTFDQATGHAAKIQRDPQRQPITVAGAGALFPGLPK